MGNKSSKQPLDEEAGSDYTDDEEEAEEKVTAEESSSQSKKGKKNKTFKKPGKWAMMKQGYSEMVNAIIRPPRAEYSDSELGPKTFTFGGKTFERTDFEAIEALEMVLGEGMTMFAFDFAGSGVSQGDYVSLGFYEKEDIATIVDFLRSKGTVSTIGLWGRSMGAATALLHSHRDPSIAALVLDSPFADLKQLAMELVSRGKAELGYKVPGLVVKAVFRLIKGSVKKKAKFDITQLRPITDVDKAFIPALFCAASGDDFVPMHHAQAIHDKYAGDKNIVIVEGDHNSARPSFFLDSAAIFLRTTMQVPENFALSNYAGTLSSAWRRARRSAGGAAAAASGEVPQSLQRMAELEEEMLQRAIEASTRDMGEREAAEMLRLDSRTIEAQQSDRLPPRTVVHSETPSGGGGGGGGGGGSDSDSDGSGTAAAPPLPTVNEGGPPSSPSPNGGTPKQHSLRPPSTPGKPSSDDSAPG